MAEPTSVKQVTTILLALVIFLQPFSKIWIFVSFKINQESIAKTLCVKKDIENNTCQGQCHLKKQIDKADKEEQKQTPSNTKEKLEVLYCYNQFPLECINRTIFYERRIISAYRSDFYAKTLISDIFHPPKQI
jgi:hypothetical protein